MNFLRSIPLAILLALLAVIAIATVAEATGAAAERSCAFVERQEATGLRSWQLDINETGFQCGISTPTITNEFPTGSPFTITCTEAATGTSPPGVAQTLTIRAYPDDAGFPAGASGFAWTHTVSGASCATPQTITRYCTVDGTENGAKRHGVYRLYINAVRTSLVAYNVNSDTDPGSGNGIALWGLYRCNPVLITYTDIATATSNSPTRYQGGDTLRSDATLASTSTETAAIFTARIACGTGASLTLTGTSTLARHDSSVAMPAYSAGCDLKQSIEITGTSTLTGWTGTPVGLWYAIPAGTTLVTPTKVERDITTTVSYTGSFDALRMARTAEGANASTFIIGEHQLFTRAEALRDPRGNLLSGIAVSCQRTKPDLSTETSVSMGNTDANGHSPEKEFSVIAPKDAWKMRCTATTNGNTASYEVTYFQTSPFTADSILSAKWNVTLLSNGSYRANVTAMSRAYDPTTGHTAPLPASNTPTISLYAYEATTGAYTRAIVAGAPMTPHGTPPSWTYHYTHYTRNAADIGNVFAIVNAQLAGRPFIGAEGYSLTFWENTNTTLQTHDTPVVTAIDPYVTPTFYIGAMLVTVATTMWGATRNAPALKIGLIAIYIALVAWMLNQTVDTDHEIFRLISVAIIIIATILLAWSVKAGR